MPYKPTGRPNGRPRKNPLPAAETVEKAQPPRVNLPRTRARFRMLAELKNPSPYLVMYDARGRPRKQRNPLKV